MFQLVNTNFLVPKISSHEFLEYALEELQQETLSRLEEYTEKVYVVQKGKDNLIYTSDGKHIYLCKLVEPIEKKIIYIKNCQF